VEAGRRHGALTRREHWSMADDQEHTPETRLLARCRGNFPHASQLRTLYGTLSALVSIVSGRVRAPVQIIVEDDHDALGQRPGPNDRFC
jgi:hypothetical protein